MDCIFCKIARRETPSKIIYEDDVALAFEDAAPQAPVHTLVIPKRHISTVLDLKEEDDGLVGHLFRVAADVARDRGIDGPGFRLVMNTNRDAGQTVFHIHLHLLGGRAMGWPPG